MSLGSEAMKMAFEGLTTGLIFRGVSFRANYTSGEQSSITWGNVNDILESGMLSTSYVKLVSAVCAY